MGNVKKYKRPQLLVLEETKKIREYEEVEKNKNVQALMLKLLLLLGVGENSDSKHHLQAAMFMKDALENFSFEQIDYAFKLFVKGEFPTKPLQQLNSVILGQVMREYTIYSNERLKVFRREEKRMEEEKKMSESEIDRLMLDAYGRAEKELIENGEFEYSKWHLYDWMVETGRMNEPDDEYKKAAYKMIKRKMIEKARENEKEALTYWERKKSKIILEKIIHGDEHTQIVNRAKSEILKNHIKKFLNKK